MKYIILFALLLVGCAEPPTPKLNIQDFVVDKKYCISECMSHTFSMFHNNGSSWGTGSSSMNGLSQEKIFDRVKKECQDFYNNETCCHVKYPLESWDSHKVLLSVIHSYKFGVCQKGVKE